MILTTDHYAAQSLKEFLNYKSLTELQSFKNVSGVLTEYSSKFENKKALGSPWAGFVYDSEISGANVITELPGIPEAQIDYRNGRFIVPTGENYTGSLDFAVNEINFYITSSPESKLIFETQFEQNSTSGFIPPDSFVAPCVFIKDFFSESEDHNFGGEERLFWIYKVIAMAQRESELIGIQKIVRESKKMVFPFITGSLFNKYGNLTSEGWSYQSEIDNMTDYCLVTDSTFKIVELDVFTDDNPKMYVGIGNVEVSYFKTPNF